MKLLKIIILLIKPSALQPAIKTLVPFCQQILFEEVCLESAISGNFFINRDKKYSTDQQHRKMSARGFLAMLLIF